MLDIAKHKKTVSKKEIQLKFVKTNENGGVGANLLVGVMAKTAYQATAGQSAYALQAVEGEAKFCLVGESDDANNPTSFAANTAYLVLPAGQNQTIGLRFGDATLIERVENVAENGVIYDLMGRRVENATKGVYIMNGKKVLVK